MLIIIVVNVQRQSLQSSLKNCKAFSVEYSENDELRYEFHFNCCCPGTKLVPGPVEKDCLLLGATNATDYYVYDMHGLFYFIAGLRTVMPKCNSCLPLSR